MASTEKELKVYPGVESLNIFENDQVISDVIEWLDAHLSSIWDHEKRDVDVPEGTCEPPPNIIIEKVE